MNAQIIYHPISPHSEMDFSDDDDISFKIRRASAKLLQALITAYPASLAQFYRSVAPALMKRTLEREEGVRLEVLATLTMLLGQVSFSRGESCGLSGTAVSSGRNSPANEVMSPSVGRKKRKSTKSDAPMDLDEA